MKYRCVLCGFEYEGDSLPEDYVCPVCGAGPEDFEVVEDWNTKAGKGFSSSLKFNLIFKSFVNKDTAAEPDWIDLGVSDEAGKMPAFFTAFGHT